jgi:AcrR family transcriptional regulator
MTKATRTRLDVDERRALLLAAAADLFEQRAYDAVSIEDVAAAAGVSKGLVYHYFSGKRELYVAHVERGAREALAAIIQSVAEVDDDAPNDARLRAALRGWMLHVRAHARTYETVVRGGLGSDADVQQIATDLRAEFTTVLGAIFGGHATTDLGPIAIAGWLGFVESATLEWVNTPQIQDPEPVIEIALAVLAAAIAAARDER